MTEKPEFEVFFQEHKESAPLSWSLAIHDQIQQDLKVEWLALLLKFYAIQWILGSVTLAFCQQFGFGQGHLAMIFMSYGEALCMVLCGAFFMGFGALGAAYLLKDAELTALRRQFYWPLGWNGILLLWFFSQLGAEILFSLGAFWLLGGLIATVSSLELGRYSKNLLA